jgi:hypothetical protein
MLPALLLIIAAIALRIVTGLAILSGTTSISNFAPLAAIALCSAAYFPARYKFTVPFAALLVSDVVLDLYYGYSLASPFVISHYIGFAIVACLGLLLSGRASFKTLLPASIGASVIFYLVTNSVSWIYDPGYAKTFAGFIQAQTVGLAVYGGTTPSWMFLRNSLVGDLFFTALFVACMKFSGRHTAAIETRQPLPRTA